MSQHSSTHISGTLPSGEHILAYEKFTPSHPARLADNIAGIVFLGGFMSDMQGSKALYLQAFCEERQIPYVRFDYMGHGKSTGKFEDGNIGTWIANTLDVIDNSTDGKQIIVGSSMGGWIMLHATLQRSERVHALLGIAAAPDFTERLIWDLLDDAQKQQIQRGEAFDLSGECNAPDEEISPYPITWQLIEDGRKHLLLDAENIAIYQSIRLLHGMQDSDVPYQYSLDIAHQVCSENVAVTLLKKGDHRMSAPDALMALGKTLEEIIAF